MKLSVVIPTYNRAKLLIKLVNDLVKILPSWAEIVVLDNASDQSNLFEDFFLNEISTRSIKFIKHNFNVEGNENILRCFEYSNGDWVWVLGDDDQITPQSFDIILYNLKSIENRDTFFIHFNWEHGKYYSNTNPINNFKDLFNSIHSLGDLNFISSNLVKRDSIKAFCGMLHFYQLSATPIASIALFGLNNNIGSICLSNDRIVENGFFSAEKDLDDHWDVELVLGCISILVFYPFNLNNKKILIKEIDKICTLFIAFKSSIRKYVQTENTIISIYNFKEILKLKLIYGSIFDKIIIEVISMFLFISIKPISKIVSKLS